eukprot:m.242882 g.242882  ORF g.242882 m.242882 type:complete len:397 (-) comp17455_c2_seq1:202-1392(-)
MATTICAADVLSMFQCPQSFAIIDVRSRKDYEKSRLCSAFNLINAPILLRRLRAGCLPLTKAIQSSSQEPISDNVFESRTVVVYGYGTRDCDSERLAAVLSGCIASQYTCHFVERGYAALCELGHQIRSYQSSSSPSASSHRSLQASRPLSLVGLPLRTDFLAPSTPRRQLCCQRSSGTTEALSRVMQGLYVGCVHDATDEALLLETGISHVLSVIEQAPDVPAFADHHHLAIADNMNAALGLLPHLKTLAMLVHEAIKDNGRVLIHCSAGISRSPTVALAYLMLHQGQSLAAAQKLVSAARPIVSPNLAFLGVLQQLEAEIRTGGVEQRLAALHMDVDGEQHSSSMSRSPSSQSFQATLVSQTASSKSSTSNWFPLSAGYGSDASSSTQSFVNPI